MELKYDDVKALLLGLKVMPESLADYEKLVNAIIGNETLDNVKLVEAYCRKQIKNTLQEEFHVITLNGDMEIIKDNLCTVGADYCVIANPEIVFRIALVQHAHSIIIWHTHPNKSCNPSTEDDDMTRRIAVCGEVLGVTLVDSLILPLKSPLFYSYAKEKRLEGFIHPDENGTPV